MRRFFSILLVLSIVSLGLFSCGPKKEATSKDAIKVAESMSTLKEKADYLIGQAKAFYGSKQFQDAIDSAQYVLRYLDKESEEAKGLIQKAKDALTTQAQKAVDDAKKAMSDFGK